MTAAEIRAAWRALVRSDQDNRRPLTVTVPYENVEDLFVPDWGLVSEMGAPPDDHPVMKDLFHDGD